MDYPIRTHDAIVYIDDAEPEEPMEGQFIVLHSLADLSSLAKLIGCKQ